MKNLSLIIYVSTASQEMNNEEIAKLLTKSRDKNRAHDVTGVLVLLNNRFIQVLEGEQKVIEYLYSKIRLDTRHTEVTLIVEAPIHRRSFEQWSMGYLNFSKINETTPEGYVNPKTFIQELEQTDTWSPSFEFLKKFYNKNR